MCPKCAAEDKAKRPGSDLPKLAAPALRALDHAGIRNLAQLAKRTEAEITKLHGMGPNALGKLKDSMKARGLSFR